MGYLFETELLENKSVILAIANVYGVGLSTARLISKSLGFSTSLKIKQLTPKQMVLLEKVIRNMDLELGGDLKKIRTLNIKRLITIKSYRGLRMFQGLPVRGQRTHSNAKTAKKLKRR
jgi:small subunit ribosomal protein S13